MKTTLFMKAGSTYVSKDLSTCLITQFTSRKQLYCSKTVRQKEKLPIFLLHFLFRDPNLLKSIQSIHLQRLRVTDDSKLMYAGLITTFFI